MHHVSKHH